MMKILSSMATEAAGTFRREQRREGERNVDWVRRQIQGPDSSLTRAVSGSGGETGSENAGSRDAPTLILLLGGRTATSFRVRVAQSHVRHDLTPSQWSHAALVGGLAEDDLGATVLYEISMEPPDGFGFPTPDNGLQVGRLSAYDDAGHFPNIALLRVPVPMSEWLEGPLEGEISILERFKKQRSVLDATELLLDWLAFVWGVGGAANPLLGGQGVPSAAMIEGILSAAQFDVTPGLESRASCPEAIWQAAKWWHTYYSEQDQDPIEGWWHIEHRLADY